MKENNINDFDTLKLYVKKDKEKEIIKYYKVFHWDLVSSEENKRYEDIVDLTFSRPHKIENKDELQLLQIYMEEKLNEQVKIKKNKYSKSTAFGLCFGVIGVLLMVLGILSCVNILTASLIGSISLLALGGVLIVIFSIALPRIIKKEKLYFNDKSNEIQKDLSDITKRVISLTGEKYEQ